MAVAVLLWHGRPPAANSNVNLSPKFSLQVMCVGHSSLTVKTSSFLDSGHACLIPLAADSSDSALELESVHFTFSDFQSQIVIILNVTITKLRYNLRFSDSD